MSKLLNTRTSVSLYGMSGAKIKLDLCGDITTRTPRVLFLLWIPMIVSESTQVREEQHSSNNTVSVTINLAFLNFDRLL